jgi:hypothetical protein
MPSQSREINYKKPKHCATHIIHETKFTKQFTELKQLMSKADGDVINESQRPGRRHNKRTTRVDTTCYIAAVAIATLTTARPSTFEYRSDKYTNDSIHSP